MHALLSGLLRLYDAQLSKDAKSIGATIWWDSGADTRPASFKGDRHLLRHPDSFFIASLA
jgi:hypothetical protein